MPDFKERLADAQHQTNSSLCVGLDPDPERLPDCLRHLSLEEAVRRFCIDIIESTCAFASAFKPNLAFFENLGVGGYAVLHDVIRAIPTDRIVIADGKRGDIGNTARMYASAVFENLGCTACTVSPYMGSDAVIPFLEWPERCAFVLIRTSNPGARDLQELIVDGSPVYVHVARSLLDWSDGLAGSAGIVVGATDLTAISKLRAVLGNLPFLIPGVGAQGGRADEVMSAALGGPVLINSSRQILYASSGTDYATVAGETAAELAGALRPQQ